MSINKIKYNTLYNQLAESIDFEKSTPIALKLNQDVRFKVKDLDVGVKIEKFDHDGKIMFQRGSILYNKFNPNTYYNIGFDIEDSTIQKYKTDYNTLANILGIVVKSTLEWIKQNNPDVVTVIPFGKNDIEAKKKLSIYASILHGNESLLNSIGYYWDTSKFMGKPGLYIAKIK
jgi:hypothetical protein